MIDVIITTILFILAGLSICWLVIIGLIVGMVIMELKKGIQHGKE